jgi:hypothetical protein
MHSHPHFLTFALARRPNDDRIGRDVRREPGGTLNIARNATTVGAEQACHPDTTCRTQSGLDRR